MPLCLARGIGAAKWRSHTNIGENEISADAVIADLKTSENSLSFWLIDASKPEEIEQVVIALAATKDNLDKIDLVWVPEEKVRELEVELREVPGQTPAAKLAHLHRDVVGIDIFRLGKLASLIYAAVVTPQICARRYTQAEVKDLLKKAMGQDWVRLADLKPSLAAKFAPTDH